MDKFKLQWKIFAFLLGFCALLLMVFWMFQTMFLRNMYKEIRKTEIKKAMAAVEQNINNPSLQAIIWELESTKEIIVTPSVPANDIRQTQRPERDNRGKVRMETITKNKAFILANGQTVDFTFHAIITPVEATVATLRVQLYFITVFMVMLSVGLALIIARRVSKPIVEINKSAKKLALGDYNTQFDGRGFLEIKELSDTLNTAAVELSKVEGFRRELLANISHDLRTPLALIYSYAEVMHDFPSEITAEQTQIIMDETKRLTSLVNDVLDLSKLESGSMELKKSRYNFTKSIEIMIDRMSELIKKEGYIISFEFDGEVDIVADEVKITQAFYNLLINAINYSGKDKKITVRQTTANGSVKIEVIDNGEGIAPENLQYIWDRYYKIDKKHKRAVTGTGLGLSIVKKFIDLHGGSYGVESILGEGSNFWFCLKIE